MSSPLHGWLKTTCLVERGKSPSAKNHFQRMSCSFWCIICQPNFLVYFPISFGTHHTPNPAQPVEHWIAVPRTFHSITDTFRCGAYHSLLSSACSPSRSWHPYHTQLSLSHWGFLFRIAGYGRGKKKKEREKKFSVLWRLCHFISKHWQFTLESPRRKIKPCSPTFQKSSRTRKPNNPSFPPTAGPVAQVTKPDLALLQARPADVARTSPHCRNDLRQICSQPKRFQQ